MIKNAGGEIPPAPRAGVIYYCAECNRVLDLEDDVVKTTLLNPSPYVHWIGGMLHTEVRRIEPWEDF